MAGIQHKPVGVFWDIENCAVPRNKSPSDVIAHIRNFFVFNRLNHREYEFIISCDVTRLRKDIPEDINKAGGVTLAHVNGSSKNAADEKLRENMKKFVDTHTSGSSPVLILISGDIDFVNDLRGYQTRLGCTIVLIHASNCSPQFKVGWNEIYCFTSFCSAVKDNPTLGSAANPKNIPKKPSQKNLNGFQNQNQNQGALAPSNVKQQGGQKVHPKNPPEQSEARNQPNEQKPPYRQPGNRKEVAQQSTGFIQAEATQNLSIDKQPFRPPVGQHQQGKRFPNPLANQGQSVPTQNQGTQPPQGNKFKPPRNAGPRTNNDKSQNIEYQPTNESGTCPTTSPTSDKPAANKFILMVGGLPGKMDFKILKENLQFQANKVHGKVKYVKNGQAFITFRNKENADRAVELFNGKQVFGKTLNVSFTKSIPFENQPNDKLTPDSGEFVMVKKGDDAEGTKKSKNKATNKDYSKTFSRETSSSNGNLSNDPVLTGLGSIISGIVANRMAAANTGNKSPESCPIQ